MTKLALIVLSVAACGGKKQPDAVDPNKALKTAVDDLPVEIPEYPAIISTKDTKLITTETGGKINKIFVRPGQRVKADDIIMELDDQELKSQAERAKAAISSARHEAGAAYADAGNASHKADVQGRLLRGGAGTAEAVREAQSSAAASGSRGAAASDRAKSSEEEYNETMRLIGLTKVRAGIDGEVVYVNAREGGSLQKNQSFARVSDTKDLRVKFLVPLTLYKTLKRGQSVQVFMPNHDGDLFAKVIDFTASSENRIESVIVEADIDDSKLKEEVSASGTGYVRFVTEGGKS